MGRQPFGLASPAAWLRREGIDVRLVDIAKEKLDPGELGELDLVAFHLPMHTATRLAAPVIRAMRASNPAARICAYGVYAPLNAEWLRSLGVDDVLGGEFEEELAAIAKSVRIVRRSAFGAVSPIVRRTHERRTTNGASSPSALPGPRPLRPSAAVALRHAAARRRHAADRRLHGGVPRMPSSVPALSDRAGLRRAVPGGASRRSCSPTSKRRWPRGRGTSPSAIPISSTVPPTPGESSSRCTRPIRRLVRRDDQDRAPAPPSRAPPGSSRHRMRVRDERRRIAGRPRARAAAERDIRGPISSPSSICFEPSA